jgi:hypothetical protein
MGESQTNIGVFGTCAANSPGVQGVSVGGHGVHGESTTNHAVHGESAAGRGVVGISQTFVGVTGTSTSSDGVFGSSVTGIGVHGQGKKAGLFEGDVKVAGNIAVTGDISLLNADCAEDFDVIDASTMSAGTVMVLDDTGQLTECTRPYDKRVAGVISGAGDYTPGIVLDRRGKSAGRLPVALLGKVYCKVDAQFGHIEVGDLLTSSATPGHAMRTAEPSQAFGAVIGKALRRHTEGQALIPILVSLQ